MKISKQRLACLLSNAIVWLRCNGAGINEIEAEIGIADEELMAIEKGNVEECLTDDERFKIALEVDRENKLSDIKDRVRELWEDESPNLNGLTADEIIGDEELMKNILIRSERAEGWMDNGSYWYLIDDCIKDGIKNGGQKNNG